MLLVTCSGLFWAVALQCGKVKQMLENMPALWTHSQAADQGLVSPATTGDLHSTPSQREQQAIACCHRPHRPNHKEELTSHLSDKAGFKFHYENLMRKEMLLNRKILTNWKASGQALIKISGNEGGSWSPNRYLGSPVLTLFEQWNYSAPQRRSSHDPHPMGQGCDCNRHHIPGDWGSASSSMAAGCSWHKEGPEEGDIQHPLCRQHCSEAAPQEEGACFSASLGSRGHCQCQAGKVPWLKQGRCSGCTPCSAARVAAALSGLLELRACTAGAAARHRGCAAAAVLAPGTGVPG